MRIAVKIRVFAVLIVLFSSIGAALVAYLGYTSSIVDLESESMENLSDAEIKSLTDSFGELARDIRFISKLPDVIQMAESDSDLDKLQRAKESLTSIFSGILSAKAYYKQIRLIGIADQGREIVRVDQSDGQGYIVPKNDLQTKGDRKYFQDCIRQPPGVPYYSKIDLNREHGEIEIPIQPTLRIGMPVHGSSGELFGIVIINLEFDSFVEDILIRMSSRYDYYLVNGDGYFLLHPAPSHTFGFELGTNHTFMDEFPELADFLESRGDEVTSRAKSFGAGTGELVHFKKFSPFNDQRILALGMVASYRDISHNFTIVIFKICASVLLLIFIASVVGYFFADKITRSLGQISEAGLQMTRGEKVEESFLPIQLGDEIGDLAKTFNAMKEAVRNHENHLLSANEKLIEANRDLEHFAHISAHELKEPIRRIISLATIFKMAHQEGQGADSAEVLNQLERECERAMAQISDFRTYARISKEPLVRETVSINTIVEEVLEEYREPCEEQKVKVLQGTLPEIGVYPNLVKALYRTLVDNALSHASREGFTLSFKSRELVSGIHEFSVENTASTLDKKHLSEAFQVFTRFNNKNQGTGMGLSIAKRIVDRHSGKIWMEAKPDSVQVLFTLESPDLKS